MYQDNSSLLKKQFESNPGIKNIVGNVIGSAIGLYFCAGLTFIISVLVAGNIAGIIDVALLVGFGLGIQFAKSRVCSIAALIYSIINLVIIITMTGSPGGWLIIVLGVYAVISTFKYQAAWKNFRETGMI